MANAQILKNELRLKKTGVDLDLLAQPVVRKIKIHIVPNGGWVWNGNEYKSKWSQMVGYDPKWFDQFMVVNKTYSYQIGGIP